MKKFIQPAIAMMVICLLTGCETTGLSPREHSGTTYSNYILSLQTNSTNVSAKKMATPIRLAVAQVGETTPPRAILEKLTSDKTLVTSAVGLPLPGETENRFYGSNQKSDSKIEDYAGRINSLRNLARVAGADYIFIFGGSLDSWERQTALSALDITIVGGIVAPGTRINMEGKGAGALVDVASGEPVLFVSAEAKDSRLSPDYLAQGKSMSMRVATRDELVGKLSDELLKKLAGLNSSKTLE